MALLATSGNCLETTAGQASEPHSQDVSKQEGNIQWQLEMLTQTGQTQDKNSPNDSPQNVSSSEPNSARVTTGSPYVELDSWIYPVMERLAALGYIHSEFLDMRPWTRIECARMVRGAGDRIKTEGSAAGEANRLYTTLEKEFQQEMDSLAGGGSKHSIRLESLYASATGVNGQPLDDSYHFGQTIINNDGRPYEEGFNSYDGLSGYATSGRFTMYVRGEYQHAPSAPAYSLPVRQAIATMDINPLLPPTPVPTTNQFRLLDTYIAANVANWNLAFGKQSLWWGPGDGGALLFSDNAEPIYMFRVSRITAITIPLLSRLLGPFRLDAFFGKLSGNEFPPRPLIHGEKISFRPTQNLEFGFSRTSELGGVGRPLTIGSIWRSYFSVTSSGGAPPANNAGKRTGGFDFSYRLPFVRDWLTLYADSLSDDDPSPIDAPRRAGISPGIYLSRIPGLQKLDLRIEGVYTDTISSSVGGHFIYYDSFYHDLYTDKKNLIGDWIGREGMGFQGWSTYWFTPRSSLQIGYRHAKVAKDFIPGGETLNDGSVKVNWWVHRDLSLSAYLQYEKWFAPTLAPTAQTNWTSSVEVAFWPQSWDW
jgi:hypothetical protein